MGNERCGYRLQILAARARRPVMINRIACPRDPLQGDLEGDLALADKRSLWKLVVAFSNESYEVSVRTTSIRDPHVTRPPCCKVEYAVAPVEGPSWPIAGSGHLLVYYSQSGYYHQSSKGALMRVVGRKLVKLFEVQQPVELAVADGESHLSGVSSGSSAR